ncbi:probable phospholipid hydroperoxide glutathione peroxidase [Andrographis paniculata]|uniref:probable phospholipid hydroperoxide glutathione peroxidase n=1 Tax=Andrographis paniculata TaxID=175694 RepID=UPI0021E6F78E|nr:probable phospholipid hydroperoxide glutathione peroxidase [Andrographis paniculata]
MASSSMAFASVFSAPLHSLAHLNLKGNSNSASMVFLDLYSRANLASSKSEGFGTRFSALSPTISALPSKSRHFSTINARAATEKTIHDFTVKDIDGKDISLSKFKDRVLLIVNVASQCGLTSSNYKELTHLYEKYKPQGLEILAFPCNQFGGQEPGSNPQIKEFACTRYKAEFPIFDKVDVNGPNTAPVYQFLKSNAGGFLGALVKWNFEKFLVDKNGKVVERYPPTTSPFQIEKDIKKLLAA